MEAKDTQPDHALFKSIQSDVTNLRLYWTVYRRLYAGSERRILRSFGFPPPITVFGQWGEDWAQASCEGRSRPCSESGSAGIRLRPSVEFTQASVPTGLTTGAYLGPHIRFSPTSSPRAGSLRCRSNPESAGNSRKTYSSR
jgi:hypothetical protein